MGLQDTAGGDRPQRLRLVFLLGVAFSGSTALGNLINNDGRAVYVGELNLLPRFSERPLPVAWCIKCHVEGTACPDWSAERVSELEGLPIPGFFRALFDSNETDVIVEGSKEPDFLTRLLPSISDDYDIRAVVTKRNPIRAMASYMVAAAEEGAPVRPHQAANLWRDTYVNAIRTINIAQVPAMAFDTSVLRETQPGPFYAKTFRLLEFIGMTNRSGVTEATSVRSLLAPTHQLWGNPGTQGLKPSVSAEFAAENWDELTEAFVRCPSAVDIASQLGIDVGRALTERPVVRT